MPSSADFSQLMKEGGMKMVKDGGAVKPKRYRQANGESTTNGAKQNKNVTIANTSKLTSPSGVEIKR